MFETSMFRRRKNQSQETGTAARIGTAARQGGVMKKMKKRQTKAQIREAEERVGDD